MRSRQLLYCCKSLEITRLTCPAAARPQLPFCILLCLCCFSRSLPPSSSVARDAGSLGVLCYILARQGSFEFLICDKISCCPASRSSTTRQRIPDSLVFSRVVYYLWTPFVISRSKKSCFKRGSKTSSLFFLPRCMYLAQRTAFQLSLVQNFLSNMSPVLPKLDIIIWYE